MWNQEKSQFLQELNDWESFLRSRNNVRCIRVWFEIYKQRVRAYIRERELKDDLDLFQIHDHQTKRTKWIQYELYQNHIIYALKKPLDELDPELKERKEELLKYADSESRKKWIQDRISLLEEYTSQRREDLVKAKAHLRWIKAQSRAVAAESALSPTDETVRYYQEQVEIYKKKKAEEYLKWKDEQDEVRRKWRKHRELRATGQQKTSCGSDCGVDQKPSGPVSVGHAGTMSRPSSNIFASQENKTASEGTKQAPPRRSSLGGPRSQKKGSGVASNKAPTNRVARSRKRKLSQTDVNASTAILDSSGPVSSRLRSNKRRHL